MKDGAYFMYTKLLNQNTKKRRDLILNGPLTKTIIMLSIPTLMMGLVQSLMPIIDGLFINNILGTLVASSITYSGPIINIISSIAMGLSVAGMALIGQMNGKGDLKNAKLVSTQLIIFSFFLGLIVAPLLFIIAFPISKTVNSEISHNVFIYLSLNALVIPFSFLESIYNAIKNAAGKPEAPFIRTIIMLVLKVLFNILFIIILPLGIIGAVIASFASNLIICLWMYYDLFIKESEDKLPLKGFYIDKVIIRRLVNLAIPSILSSMMLNLGFLLINNEIQKYGPSVLAAQGIAGSISAICFIIPSSFGAAVTTMVSMSIGAGFVKRAKYSCLVGCILSSITAIILIIIVVPLSSSLTVLFTQDKNVLFIANKSLHIYTYSVVGFGICMVEQGAFIGLGRTKMPLFLSILRIWLLRYIFILFTDKYLQFYSVFWGNLFSNYLAAIITTIIILKIKWFSAIPAKGEKSNDHEFRNA